jgi:drug/metabolite transporter (DMT)-like permease
VAEAPLPLPRSGAGAPALRQRDGHDRRPWLGYSMALTAAVLWAVNGTVVKVIQVSGGMSSLRLGEIRNTLAFVLLALVLALTRPALLRVRARELPFLVVFGVAGLALVQWLYLVAIDRMPIGIALLVEYIAPVFVALWARFVLREHVRGRVWLALALALVGLSVVVEVWSGISLDGVGLAAALGAALALAGYLLMAEHGVRERDPLSLVCFGFLFGSLFWALVQPWWSFPVHLVDDSISLLGNLEGTSLPVWILLAYMVVLGTIVPFALMVGSLRHASATTIGIVAMLEPVVASVVAFAWLGESLGAAQLAGGAVVLAGIILAQTSR